MLLRAGYAYVPYASLESVIEQNKESYYLALRRTQTTIHNKQPDWQPWLLFFLKALERQKNHLAAKIEREKIVVAQLPELSVRILDFAREHGRASTGEIVRIAGASRNTLKQQFRQLVERGYLARHGGGRTTWYTLR
jgi:Fic family protein